MRLVLWVLLMTVTCAACANGVGVPPTPIPQPQTGPIVGPSQTITVSDLVGDMVRNTDPQCYPSWDGSARCRWFKVQPSASGTLTITLSAGRGVSALDLFVMVGGSAPARVAPGPATWAVTMSTVAGRDIDILVLAYQTPESFVLQTAFATP